MNSLNNNGSIEDYRRQVFDLNTMLEIGKTLNASLSLNDVLDIVILTCNGHFHSSDAIIFLSVEKNNRIVFVNQSKKIDITIDSNDPLLQYIKENQRVIQLEEMKQKKELQHLYELFKNEEIELIVPLRFKGRINGILCLKKKEEYFGEYTEEEKKYIDIIAGFASVAIENARLYEMATLDKKTGLYNHGFFQNRLIEEIARAERYKSDLSLLMMDLDHFKNINDTYGHMVGDEVLMQVAKTIKAKVRAFDIPARFGGEEFTVILPETGVNDTSSVAERLRKSIQELSFSSQKGSFSIKASIGIAEYVHSVNMTEDILIEHADRALYYAKEHGRNQVVVYENIADKVTS
ncbi:MAG: diguanylate cyclase [Spirochaetota bacterium]